MYSFLLAHCFDVSYNIIVVKNSIHDYSQYVKKELEKMKENQTVRELAKKKGVKHWQIAGHLGISEATIMRWLRIPLSPERERIILNAIESIAKEGI